MPISYVITPSLIFITLEGQVTEAELIREQRNMMEDERFVGTAPRLIFADGLTELLVSGETIRTLAHKACDRGMRRAALVAGTEVVFALCRMYEAYAYECDADCRVFRSREQAVEWLEQPY